MNPPPSPITEAAGLLQSGALLTRRVGLRPADADPAAPAEILAGFKPGGFSLYFGDAPIYHFDLEGRWQRAFRDGTHYLKGLDGRVRVVDRVREGDQMILRRRTLAPGEVERLDGRIGGDVASLGAAVAAGSYVALPPPGPAEPIPPAELIDLLTTVAGWGPTVWGEHRAAYRAAYGDGPTPFLPPDCPNPVVLRISPGMTAEGMRDHTRGVAGLLGRRLAQCRDVFLVGPGWLDRPGDEVVGLLGAVHEVFPTRAAAAGTAPSEHVPGLAMVHGWLDAVPGSIPDPATWGRCRAAGLGRVSVRVDPGTDLAGLGALVPGLKRAGIGVGLVLFVAGASDLAQADRVAALPLGPGDLVTLVGVELALGAGPPAPAADLAAWKARLAAALPRPGPRVVIYNPDKQWI